MLEFLWKYIFGPIVAEAIGVPAKWRGVEAIAGYNIYNTAAWAVLGISIVLLVKKFLENKEIELTPNKAVRLLPLIFLAGVMRFVQDSLSLPFAAEVLLITPVIYVLFGFLGILFLYLDSYSQKTMKYYLVISTAALIIALVQLPQINFAPVIIVLAATSILTGFYFFVFKESKFSQTPLILAVGSQFFEAFSSMYALSQGFQARQLLTSTVVEIAGPTGFLAVKIAILGLALTLYFDLEDQWKSILLIALYSIGFATGVRVLLRAATGI